MKTVGERNMTLLYNNFILNDGYQTDLGSGVGAVGEPTGLGGGGVCEISHDYETNSVLYYVSPQSVDLITRCIKLPSGRVLCFYPACSL